MRGARVTPPAVRSRRGIGYAMGLGIALGVAYTVSPTTVAFVALAPLLFYWAQRHLGRRERVWVMGVLSVALAARLIVLGGFFLAADRFNTGIDAGRVVPKPYGALIGDERFLLDRPLWMIHLAQGDAIEARDLHDLFGDYGDMGVMQDAMAYWQLWVGEAPYGARLIGVAAWLIGAVALYRVARRSFGPLPALGGLVLVLFMPTLFVWSISALKEPPYFALTAATIAGVMSLWRGPGVRRRLLASALVVLAIAAIGTMRSVGLFVTAGGVFIAAAGWMATRRVWLAAIASVLLVAGGFLVLRQPAAQARVMAEYKRMATVNVGATATSGYAYWLLDPYFYSRFHKQEDPVSALQPIEAARYTLRAAASFFALPLPWQAASLSTRLLLPQQIVWYLLTALAAVGLVSGWRRDAAFAWVLAGNILLGAAAVSLYNGNVGTFVRMRDSVVPLIVWLSALGGCVFLERIGRSLADREGHAHS